MTQFKYDMTKNDISAVRFGNLGAAGSETWIKGDKMKPYQIQKLKELLKAAETESRQKVENENFENMFD